MIVQEIKAALETLNNPLTYNQALVDCRSALNLSVDTMINHFQQWLWVSEDTPAHEGPELFYAIQLGKIEEFLCEKGLIYND